MGYRIINELRSNGIRPLKVVADRLGMPVTTAHSKMARLRDKIRGTLLLDFDKLGYSERVIFVVKIISDRDEFMQKVVESVHVNTLHISNHNSDFIFEAVFRDALGCRKFVDWLKSEFKLSRMDYYKVIKPVKVERFELEI
jgi:DNA-binding Lrp family transcriptional regulator